jgi:hypothetical protein
MYKRARTCFRPSPEGGSEEHHEHQSDQGGGRLTYTERLDVGLPGMQQKSRKMQNEHQPIGTYMSRVIGVTRPLATSAGGWTAWLRPHNPPVAGSSPARPTVWPGQALVTPHFPFGGSVRCYPVLPNFGD